MKVGIVTDSQCGLSPDEAEELGVFVLPMPFSCGEECYYEGLTLTRDDFFKRLKEGENIKTAQPSPEDVMNLWRKALEQYDEIVYIPMSSGLSGAYNTARMLSEEEEFEDKVFVADCGRVATPLHRTILDGLELIEEGYNASKVKDILERSREKMVIYIAVETLEFLKRGGRITPTTAAIGTLLNIKPVLKLGVGVLDTYRKCRGMKKAKAEMLETMKQHLETTFRTEMERNEVYLMAASSADEATTKEWVEEIKEYFPDMEVMCDYLSLGISSHTGEGALGIGCSCRPER